MRFLVLILIFIELLNAWKMEADKITVKNTKGGVVTHIDFNQAFDTTPLVFLTATDQNSDPAEIRIKNITTTGFDVYIVEPQGEDGPHPRMTSVPYIAIEPGEHRFPDGTKIIAETIDTKKFQSSLIDGSSWETISLSGISNTPIILAQIQSTNNERDGVPDKTSQPWMSVAISNVSSSDFNLSLERSETTKGAITKTETVAYLAIDSGLKPDSHYFASIDYKKIEYETIRSDDIIKGWDNSSSGYEIDFAKSYDDPIAVATKNTRDGKNGGWLRRRDIKKNYIKLVVDEDRAKDSERKHTTERAGILVFSQPFSANFIEPSSAKLIINEVMYKETKGSQDDTNDEFIEFYVKEAGNLKGYILSTQDKDYYEFPDCEVKEGDYVIFNTGSGSDSCNGDIKYFYKGSSPILKNNGDDILLIRPAYDVVTTTQSNNPKTYNGEPIDYIAYAKVGEGSVDDVPTSLNGVKLSWNDDYVDELNNALAGVSISLTPNATDSDTSACWEFTASGNASDNGCRNYKATVDTEPDPTLTYSKGKNNNGAADMHITKSSIIISDPVNNTTNPKRIPGAIIRYCFTVDNTGDGSATNVKIKDKLSDSGRDNLIYSKSGTKDGDINSDCDCTSIDDTSGSYDSDTKEVEIDLDTMAADTRKCAYIEAEIK